MRTFTRTADLGGVSQKACAARGAIKKIKKTRLEYARKLRGEGGGGLESSINPGRKCASFKS